MDKQTDRRQADRQTDGRPNGRTDGRTDRQTYRQAGRQEGRQTGRQADRQTYRQTYRQAGRQTDEHLANSVGYSMETNRLHIYLRFDNSLIVRSCRIDDVGIILSQGQGHKNTGTHSPRKGPSRCHGDRPCDGDDRNCSGKKADAVTAEAEAMSAYPRCVAQ